MKKMLLYLSIGAAVILVLLLLIGLLLPKERTFIKTAELKSDVRTVFNLVADFKNQASWRNDVKEIVVIDSTTWTEIPKQGTALTFKVKQRKENELFEIAIVAPKNFNGYWVGRFTPTVNGGTTVTFKEVLRVSNPLLRPISYLFVDLDKTMELYLQNLKQKLVE